MNFVVAGAGAWGTALAIHLARQGQSVTLIPRRFEQALALASERENRDYLSGHRLPDDLQLGHELRPVLMEADVLVLASPMIGLREWAARAARARGLASRLRLALCLTKGLERGTHLSPSAVVRTELPGIAVGALTGPSNAAEVARGKPTALVLATDGGDELAAEVQAALSGPTLRVYTGDDLVGAELGGALKNIYAIAAGCSDGLGLGDNAKAALVTRALAEMIRLGAALGAKPETFYGLSGLGDLVATCHGSWSRNHEFGAGLGRGASIADLLGHRRTVVEGFRTTESMHGLCVERGLDAPILGQVHAMLFDGKPPPAALAALMGRELKREA
jgi:glycerol-3-phosphate dehydrogenase (NAD(P)+)